MSTSTTTLNSDFRTYMNTENLLPDPLPFLDNQYHESGALYSRDFNLQCENNHAVEVQSYYPEDFYMPEMYIIRSLRLSRSISTESLKQFRYNNNSSKIPSVINPKSNHSISLASKRSRYCHHMIFYQATC